MVEPGLDLHEWETRWAELEEMVSDDAGGAVREMVRLVEGMLVERDYNLEEPVTVEGEEPEVVRLFLSARAAARMVDAGTAEDEDVSNAFVDLRTANEEMVTLPAHPYV